jgi:hypothetical protein
VNRKGENCAQERHALRSHPSAALWGTARLPLTIRRFYGGFAINHVNHESFNISTVNCIDALSTE